MTHPISNITVRQTTAAEKTSGPFSTHYWTSSMLEAVNTCPKWGLIRNVQNKSFVTGYRQMALEAGALMHEIFAMLNLVQVGYIQGLPTHCQYHGEKEFGRERWAAITASVNLDDFDGTNQSQLIRVLEQLAYNVISTSDYYDDPEDKNRTVSNLEHCAIELVTYWTVHLSDFAIYVADPADPSAPIGVEQSLDCIFSFYYDNQLSEIRVIGLADAVYQNSKTKLTTMGEYKSSSNMNDAWQQQYATRHQVTIYSAMLDAYFDNFSGNTVLIGSSIPVRKTSPANMHFQLSRDEDQVKDMLLSLLHADALRGVYQGEAAIYAPMFTHSCNRYFRPCAFLDLCTSSHPDQEAMWAEMSSAPELSPSEMKALARKD